MPAQPMQNLATLLGRLLLACLFLPAGIAKLGGFAGTVGYIASVGLPMPQVSAALALVVEIVGALALILGLGTRWAALVLALFTLAASVFFHAFWAAPEGQQLIPQLLFFKNIGVVGGLLILAAWGPGDWSLDARRQR